MTDQRWVCHEKTKSCSIWIPADFAAVLPVGICILVDTSKISSRYLLGYGLHHGAKILRWGQSRTGGSSKHIKRKPAGEVHQNSPPANLKSDQDFLPSVVWLWSNEKSPPNWRWFFSKWWTWSDSNRRPLQCECSALPTALQAHIAAFCGIFATKSRFSGFSILEDLRGNSLRNHGLKLIGRCAAIGMRM